MQLEFRREFLIDVYLLRPSRQVRLKLGEDFSIYTKCELKSTQWKVEEKKQSDTLIVHVKEDVVSDFEKCCLYAVFGMISWLQNREEIIAE